MSTLHNVQRALRTSGAHARITETRLIALKQAHPEYADLAEDILVATGAFEEAVESALIRTSAILSGLNESVVKQFGEAVHQELRYQYPEITRDTLLVDHPRGATYQGVPTVQQQSPYVPVPRVYPVHWDMLDGVHDYHFCYLPDIDTLLWRPAR